MTQTEVVIAGDMVLTQEPVLRQLLRVSGSYKFPRSDNLAIAHAAVAAFVVVLVNNITVKATFNVGVTAAEWCVANGDTGVCTGCQATVAAGQTADQDVMMELGAREQCASYPVEDRKVCEKPDHEPEEAVPSSPGSPTLEHDQPPSHQHHQYAPRLSDPPHLREMFAC